MKICDRIYKADPIVNMIDGEDLSILYHTKTIEGKYMKMYGNKANSIVNMIDEKDLSILYHIKTREEKRARTIKAHINYKENNKYDERD